MPNEIFQDFLILQKHKQPIPFAYTYYFLISWLYRYAKYWEYPIDVQTIKRTLGYHENYKPINQLIKKDGLLDQIGYTISDTNFPIGWEFDDNEIQFIYIKDSQPQNRNKILKKVGRNYKIKIPVKGIWRNKESQEEDYHDGTFYDLAYTHEMTMDLFQLCMNDSQLGCTAFYIYGYLKYRCDKYGTYHSSLERLGEEIGLGKNTVNKYTLQMEKKGLIKRQEQSVFYVEGEFNQQATEYCVF